MASVTEETKMDMNSETSYHLEDLTIVWLDITIDSNDIVWTRRQNHLRNCINYIRTFTDQSECQKYISTIHDEDIFLITSGSMGEIIVPEIHNLSQISAIYIFCGDTPKHSLWSKLFPKIRGVFNDENSLRICLEKDTKIYSNTLLPINIGPSNEYSLQDIDKEQVKFLWFQSMIEVIYRLPQTSSSKNQMIDECRTHYADNPAQLNMIKKFYDEYNANSAIYWYTTDSFLYRHLNKAFRTQNIDLVFHYHYFVSDLTRELAKLYREQFSGKQGILKVYRGQYMHIGEVERLKNSTGRLMSVNTFFSTSTSCARAAEFSGNGECRSQGIESVIFEIQIDLSIQRRPFAKLDQLSSREYEKEILFAVGSVFRIEKVELSDLSDIWSIVLTLTDEVKQEIEDLLAYFTKHIGNQPSLMELGVLLSHVGDLERAKRFYLLLKNELPENHSDLGVLYNNLGEIYRKQGYLGTAMEYYKLATDELTDSFEFLHPWLAIVHSNIAMIYDVYGEFDQALVHYRCALHILHVKRNSNLAERELFSTIYNGMAVVFQKKGQSETALKLYEETLKIERTILPSGHPSIAITYNNIGQWYLLMGQSLKAFENYSKALPIMLSTLPDDHPDLAALHENIGVTHIHQREISQGIAHLLEAEQIIDRSAVTLNHNLREKIYLSLAIISSNENMIDLSIRMRQKLIDSYKARTPPDQCGIAHSTYSLASLLYEQGDREQAFNYQQISLNIVEQLPRTEENKDFYLTIIDSFLHTNQHSVAIEHCTRLLNEETDIESLFAGKLHNNLGVAYDYLEEDLMALKHYRAALPCYESRLDIFKNQVAIIYHNIAVILNNLSDYEDARLNLCKSLEIAPEDSYDLRGECHNVFGVAYEKTNNWIYAREHFQKAVELGTRANSHPQFIAKYTRRLQQMIIKIEENTLTDFEQIKISNKD